MTAFRGQFEHQLDDKGRVSLPSAFRRGGVDTFVLVQLQDAYLTLYPEAKWEEVEERLMDFGASDEASMNVVRRVMSHLTEVTPDKQGRILIPSALQEAAGLEGSAVLLGVQNRIEIWNPERLRDKTSEASPAQAQLQSIALRLSR